MSGKPEPVGALAEQPFAETRINSDHHTGWIVCGVRDSKFEGSGGPFMLDEIVKIFLAWAKTHEG